MAKPSEKDRVKRHFERITAANEAHKKWETEYRCDTLQKYYCGKHWSGWMKPDHYPEGYEPYTANVIYSTIQTHLPSLLFHRPQAKIEPKPPYGDDPTSLVSERAKLCEDTVQSFIDDPEFHFKEHTNLALLEANFRFGVVEVGYTADWIDNPNAGKPVLIEDDKEAKAKDGEAVYQPAKIPQREQLYLRRIPAKAFRVSVSNKNVTTENDWVGYYEWHHVEDVKRNPKYKNTHTLKATGEGKDGTIVDEADREQHKGMTKLWKLWDLRTQTRCVLAEGHEKYLLEGEAWSYLPFEGLKFKEIPDSWYPLPPIFNWIAPQDTINDIRETRRIHRKRYYRRYMLRDGSMDDTELEKIESGGDGVIAKHRGQPGEQPLLPVPDAPLGPDHDKDILEAKDDFQTIAGAVDEQGVGQSDTATQANIVNVRTQIRESAERVEVGEWLGRIVRLMVLTIRDKMQLPFWIQRNVDAIAQDENELLRVVQTWQAITADQLGTTNLDCTVDVTSLSPVSEEQRALQWNQMLALIVNPELAMLLGMSEPLLRKTLKFYGITSERDVREIAMALQNKLMMQAAQMAAASAEGTGTGATATAGATGQPAGLPAAGPSAVQ